jgi:hypothetical protein
MKPADIEILFGGEKMIFYFAAEDRVDFRQLVRDLAAYFHRRIDMRQVGVRDEARMAGGLGHCGEVLCCARLSGEFAPVTIKMAKDQGLPLNPTKISGVCGRLMCCLRYEAEAYKDFNKRAPRKGALIDTPRGSAKVVELNALRETVKLQFRPQRLAGSSAGEDEKEGKGSASEEVPAETLTVDLRRFCCKKGAAGAGQRESVCPCAISAEEFAAIEEEQEAGRGIALAAAGLTYQTKRLTSTQGTEAAIDNGERQTAPEGRDARTVADGSSKDAGDRDGGSRKSRRQRKGGSRRERRGKQKAKAGSKAGVVPAPSGAAASKTGSGETTGEVRVPRRRRR